jgi:sialic acid synthase SpsE
LECHTLLNQSQRVDINIFKVPSPATSSHEFIKLCIQAADFPADFHTGMKKARAVEGYLRLLLILPNCSNDKLLSCGMTCTGFSEHDLFLQPFFEVVLDCAAKCWETLSNL